MRQFDFHEFMGYIAPGMLLLVGVWCVWPQVEAAVPIKDISFGAFGIGIVLAYAAGQLLQSVGNIVEECWWAFWGGMPTDWIRTRKHKLIAPAQLARVDVKVGRMLANGSFKSEAVDRRQWYSITRQICAAVSAAGRGSRIDIFNGHYGLCRGMASGLVVLLILGPAITTARRIPALAPLAGSTTQPYTNPASELLGCGWPGLLIACVLLVLAIHRMHHFGVLYGREVFVQFLQLPEPGQSAGAGPKGSGL